MRVDDACAACGAMFVGRAEVSDFIFETPGRESLILTTHRECADCYEVHLAVTHGRFVDRVEHG